MTQYKKQSGWLSYSFPLSFMDKLRLLFFKNFYVGVDFCEGVKVSIEWESPIDKAMRVTIEKESQ